MLALPSEVIKTIVDHARSSYPSECCGILLGRLDPLRVTEACSGRNIAPQDPARHYLLDPRDIVAADRRAGQQGLEIIGFYHSHPDSPAVPSAADCEQAWAGHLYLIAAITAAGSVTLRAWVIEKPRRQAREQALVAQPGLSGVSFTASAKLRGREHRQGQ